MNDAGEPVSRPPEERNPFPHGPVAAAVTLIFLHYALILTGGTEHFTRFGLRAGLTREEPWRLVTSLFLHADLRHAFWNGVALLVFSVPLIGYLGYLRTATIYLASGVGGGIGAVLTAADGTTIIGSSGAVAGLFGAWVVFRLRSARRSSLPFRAAVRAAGIGLLVLPSLVNPSTPQGQPVSIGSHIAGLATGMLIGALLSRSLLPPTEEPQEEDEDPGDGILWN